MAGTAIVADKAIVTGPPPVPTRRNRMEYENTAGGIEYIDLNLAEEKEELKDRAEEEVRRAIGDELGVEVEEGQSLEDALRPGFQWYGETVCSLFRLHFVSGRCFLQ